ncbi:PLP-dependent aminotransferase family protein [Micromonospora orduensis]|uniref:PLP-dependent aminotransferase family protein n=1 Tax=Micromonospora orduensis TaxID=1420891 RepID=A0A5C4QA69_9ACTN|nr:PLP-dependent aminotransferase family protein [Micromonospora orduensis]TNH22693.1 PLP-dependent aminotransferase family protein [Micromonospora orduensis]
MTVLKVDDLHPSVSDPVLTAMNFLNEITTRFPDAISFAPGAPYAPFLTDVDVAACLQRYLDHRGVPVATLLRYGPAAGEINDLIAGALAAEEGIQVPPEAIVVTVGCQEALFVTLRAIMAAPTDVLLAVDPCYVGLAGAASVLGIDVVGVPEAEDGVEATDVAAACAAVRRSGRRPRALYLVPDFANPSGSRLSLAARHRLLAVAEQEDLLLLEDNPYGFTSGDDALPVLKALDTRQRVVYLGTMSKVCAPGVRVGYAVADQRVLTASGSVGLLADRLTGIKSMITVNTSPVAQAIVGGMLLAGEALRSREQAAHYRANLAVLVAELAGNLPADVSWRAPDGGFFVTIRLPFPAGQELVEVCAREYGVLYTPMGNFYLAAPDDNRIRLSCSNLTAPEIVTGVDRLCQFIRDRR